MVRGCILFPFLYGVAVSLYLPESCGCSKNFPMVLSLSRNCAAAPRILQWCSLTLGIVCLLRKFSNGAFSILESCGCSENFSLVLSHSWNRVVAPEIFQWCSLTPRIVWLLPCSKLFLFSLGAAASTFFLFLMVPLLFQMNSVLILIAKNVQHRGSLALPPERCNRLFP